MHKIGFEFSFTWLFVLLVGAVILSLAIFMATRLINQENAVTNTEVAAQLGAVLTPALTGVETNKYYPVSFPSETQITNVCDSSGTFGFQRLSVRVRSGIGSGWTTGGVPYEVVNKYVFSEVNSSSKTMHLVSTAVHLPYKIGDALTLYSRTYCLVDSPERLESDVRALSPEGIVLMDTRAQCPRESVVVCFEGSGCDVQVRMNNDLGGEVVKGGRTVPFIEGLFYAALVSEPRTYECQLTRLRKRASEIAGLYQEKDFLLTSRGCSSGLSSALEEYQIRLRNPALTLPIIANDAEALAQTNDRLACPLF